MNALKLDGKMRVIHEMTDKTLTKYQLDVILDALSCGERDLREAYSELSRRGVVAGSIEAQLMDNFASRANAMSEVYSELC